MSDDMSHAGPTLPMQAVRPDSSTSLKVRAGYVVLLLAAGIAAATRILELIDKPSAAATPVASEQSELTNPEQILGEGVQQRIDDRLDPIDQVRCSFRGISTCFRHVVSTSEVLPATAKVSFCICLKSKRERRPTNRMRFCWRFMSFT